MRTLHQPNTMLLVLNLSSILLRGIWYYFDYRILLNGHVVVRRHKEYDEKDANQESNGADNSHEHFRLHCTC